MQGWLDEGVRYKATRNNEIYKYEEYTDRMKRNLGRNWDWPREPRDAPLPWRTLNSEIRKIITVGDIIEVGELLYQGRHSSRGAFQASMVTHVETGATGFCWVVYEDRDYFELLPEEEEEEEEYVQRPRRLVRLELTSDILRHGLQTEPGTDYELILPVMVVQLNPYQNEVSQGVKFTLFSTEVEGLFRKTLTKQDNRNSEGQVIELHYQGPPRDLRYTLEVETAPDAEGNVQTIQLFSNAPYDSTFALHSPRPGEEV